MWPFLHGPLLEGFSLYFVTAFWPFGTVWEVQCFAGWSQFHQAHTMKPSPMLIVMIWGSTFS